MNWRVNLVAIFLVTALSACGSRAPDAAATAAAPKPGAAAAPADEHGHEEAGDEHDHAEGDEHDHDEHEEGEPDFAKIDPARGVEFGIKTATAAAGPIDEAVTLTGRLIIDPRRVAAVRARFPGPVTAVHKEVGDPVRKGEALASVESNESLTVYRVAAPISGVVLSRGTNVGDVAGAESLFTVGDVSALIAELQAFTATQAQLRVGAPANIMIQDRNVRGRIASVAPELEGRTQARRVRVSLTEKPGPAWVSGQFVTGQISVGANTPVAVAVPAEAVRKLENRDVVFIPEEEGYRARAVKVGRRGLSAVEILEGLDAGEQFVSAGAFLLKAEIGKNLAEHEH